MVFLVLFAMAYGVAQIFAIASPTRSISWRLPLLAFLAGLSASAGLALFLQRECLFLLSFLLDVPASSLVLPGSYLQDPVIEEISKVLPLLALAALPRIRRSLTGADMVVLATALGSGFGFTEAALTVAANSMDVAWSDGSWRTVISLTPFAVPGPVTTVTSWLPGGTSGSGPALNLHLAWSAVTGLGVAVAFRPGKWWWLAVVPLVFASLDHAAFNADLRGVHFPLGISSVFGWVHRFTALYPVVALMVAFGFDHVRLRHALDSFPPLPIEHAKKPRNLIKLWRLVLVRRELALSDDEQDWDGAASRLEELTDDLVSPEPATPVERVPVHRWLRYGKILITVIFAGPPLIFFATAGFPHLAWVREFFAAPPVFFGLKALSVAGLIVEGAAVLAVILLIRRWRMLDGRFLLVQGLTLFSALGGLMQGALALVASVGRDPLASISQPHILEHWIQSNPLTAVMLAIAIAGLAVAGLWLLAPEIIALLEVAGEEGEGIGAFVRVTESMSEKAAAYQARVTGTPRGWAYVVNGVKFDGFDDGMLIEAKSSYAQFAKDGVFRNWFRGQKALLKQAWRQVGAAGETPIQWRFAEGSAAEAARTLFLKEGITAIDIIHMP